MSDDSRPNQTEPPGRGLSHWLGQFLDRLGFRGGGSVREEIVEALAEENGATADLSPQERAMLSNVLSLREHRVGDVMIPRADIVAVPADATLDELLALFRTAGHSRLPVFDDSLDEPRGMVHIRDFLEFIAEQAKAERTPGLSETAFHDLAAVDLSVTLATTKILRPVLYVPPSMPAVDLLVKMQATRTHIALVIDEYGGTDGLVSIEDLIEIVVGDIEDEHDEIEGPMIRRVRDGSLIAKGRAPLEDVQGKLGESVDLAGRVEDVDTLGGLLVTLAGRVPVRGEIIAGPGDLDFEVLDADPRRVKRVRIVQRKAPRAAEAQNAGAD